jgi:hypothetical protein
MLRFLAPAELKGSPPEFARRNWCMTFVIAGCAPPGSNRPCKPVATTRDGGGTRAHTARMFQEQRRDPRELLALPLQLACGAQATTRDISATGLFFEMEGCHAMQGPLQFELQLAQFGMKFTAAGEIVRIEHREGRTGVAVRLVDPRLDVLAPDP